MRWKLLCIASLILSGAMLDINPKLAIAMLRLTSELCHEKCQTGSTTSVVE